eukprot:Seg1144.4 transcript_id=Seg1144.4/GoldUCD/mRNA.D3Y31 product="5' exonuclease Apollo" protein_id=Seg1144.4/GoldUCD/D3Y31
MADGTIIEAAGVAVDYWRPRQCPWVRRYFLSHMHSDHTQGLTPSWRHKIYCSEVTKTLLVHMIGVNGNLVETIELGVPRKFDGDNPQSGFVVTLLGANHCPGAVMFLFEGNFGRILHTGDFRADSQLLDNLKAQQIGHVDLLYLDNTYYGNSFNFPSRDVATKEVIRIIEKYPNHQVLIMIYNLGKEQLLVNIAQFFQEWIIVSEEKFLILKILQMPNMFTTKSKRGRIRVAVAKELKKQDLRIWIESKPTIAIFPTCMFDKKNHPYKTKIWEEIFFVPYSDHSNHEEIVKFLKVIKPDRVSPVVKRSNCISVEALKNITQASKTQTGMQCDRELDDITEAPRITDQLSFIDDWKQQKCDFIGKLRKHGGRIPSRPGSSLMKRVCSNKGVVFESSPCKKNKNAICAVETTDSILLESDPEDCALVHKEVCQENQTVPKSYSEGEEQHSEHLSANSIRLQIQQESNLLVGDQLSDENSSFKVIERNIEFVNSVSNSENSCPSDHDCEMPQEHQSLLKKRKHLEIRNFEEKLKTSKNINNNKGITKLHADPLVSRLMLSGTFRQRRADNFDERLQILSRVRSTLTRSRSASKLKVDSKTH